MVGKQALQQWEKQYPKVASEETTDSILILRSRSWMHSWSQWFPPQGDWAGFNIEWNWATAKDTVLGCNITFHFWCWILSNHQSPYPVSLRSFCSECSQSADNACFSECTKSHKWQVFPRRESRIVKSALGLSWSVSSILFKGTHSRTHPHIFPHSLFLPNTTCAVSRATRDLGLVQRFCGTRAKSSSFLLTHWSHDTTVARRLKMWCWRHAKHTLAWEA